MIWLNLLLFIYFFNFSYEIQRLNTSQLEYIINKNKNINEYYLIDTREQSQSKIGYIPTSILLDLNLDFKKFLNQLFLKDSKFIIINNENNELSSLYNLTLLNFNIYGYYYINDWNNKLNKINYEEITIENINKLLLNNEYILDIREIDEIIKTGIINNSHIIPLSKLNEKYNTIKTNSNIYILCKSGKRAIIAYTFLQSKNISNKLFVLEGGIDKAKNVGINLVNYSP